MRLKRPTAPRLITTTRKKKEKQKGLTFKLSTTLYLSTLQNLNLSQIPFSAADVRGSFEDHGELDGVWEEG